jgi:hypothetical protein
MLPELVATLVKEEVAQRAKGHMPTHKTLKTTVFDLWFCIFFFKPAPMYIKHFLFILSDGMKIASNVKNTIAHMKLDNVMGPRINLIIVRELVLPFI